MAKLIKTFCVTGLVILLLCLISCEQKQEPVKAKKQVRVVSKSIDYPGKKETTGKAKSLSVENTVEQGKKMQAPVSPPAIPESKPSVFPEVAPDALPSGSIPGDEANQELTMALVQKEYDTKGRVDPFIPLLSESEEKEKEVTEAEPEEDKPKRILTPLEKMDLSQIRLVAVIEMNGRFVAMVEEASGKGYEVKLGTYMGREGGQVSAITREGIVVKEYFKDFKGIRKERFQEIKFNKNEGGE